MTATPTPAHTHPDDPYTAAARLCDDDGTVRRGPMRPGVDYPCTGHAHYAGEHYRCTSPAHAVDAPYDTDAAPATGYPAADRVPHPLDVVTRDRDRLAAELADVLHDLQIAVGRDYTTAPSAAVEATRRIATLTAELEQVRADLAEVRAQSAEPAPSNRSGVDIAARAIATATVQMWGSPPDHQGTQIIGGYATAVVAALTSAGWTAPVPAEQTGGTR